MKLCTIAKRTIVAKTFVALEKKNFFPVGQDVPVEKS